MASGVSGWSSACGVSVASGVPVNSSRGLSSLLRWIDDPRVTAAAPPEWVLACDANTTPPAPSAHAPAAIVATSCRRNLMSVSSVSRTLLGRRFISEPSIGLWMQVGAGMRLDTAGSPDSVIRIPTSRHPDIHPDEATRAIDIAARMTIGEAVDAAAGGAAGGWDVLFDRFYTVVLRFAMARLGERSAAEEVAQDVFVAAATSIGSLRERRESAVEAWFIRIAQYKLIDGLRKRRDECAMPSTLASSEDVGEGVAVRMEAAAVRQAMAILTEEQREILTRRFVLDQSLECVAEATGRSVGAVKSMQHRAVGALAKHIGAREAA